MNMINIDIIGLEANTLRKQLILNYHLPSCLHRKKISDIKNDLVIRILYVGRSPLSLIVSEARIANEGTCILCIIIFSRLY